MGQLTFQATLGGSVNLVGPNTASTVNLTLPSADGSANQPLVTNGSGTLSFSGSPTLSAPALGTPASGVLTNATGLPLSTGVTGTLPVANGGTGVTTSTGSGSNVLSTSPTLVTPILGTPTSATLTNATGLPLTTGVTGVLPVSNGGTGLSSTPANGALNIGNGTGFTRANLTAGSGVTITNGAGSITIAASSAGYTGYIKTDLSKYDATLTLSSSIGTTFYQYLSVALTATTELVILWGSSSAHAAVWDNTNKVFGTPVLVRTASFGSNSDVAAYGISSTSVLMCSLPSGTSLETVVLSISGTTITVNTAVATTLANSSILFTGVLQNNGFNRIFLVGSSYVLSYWSSGVSAYGYRAITVSGTTPTIGSELQVTAGTNAQLAQNHVYSSSILVHISSSNTLLYAVPISVSGTTLTLGTQATATATASTNVSAQFSDNRIAVGYINTTLYAGIVTVTGTIATISSVDTTIGPANTNSAYIQIFGLQAIVFYSYVSTSNKLTVLTNTAGVASVGTVLTNPFGNTNNWYLGSCDTSKVFIQGISGTSYYFLTVGISSGNPVLTFITPQYSANIAGVSFVFGSTTYSTSYGNYENSQMLRTSSYKSSYLPTGTNFLTYSFDGISPAVTQQAVGFGTTGIAIKSPLSNAAGWIAYSNTNTPTVVNVRRIELA